MVLTINMINDKTLTPGFFLCDSVRFIVVRFWRADAMRAMQLDLQKMQAEKKAQESGAQRQRMEMNCSSLHAGSLSPRSRVRASASAPSRGLRHGEEQRDGPRGPPLLGAPGDPAGRGSGPCSGGAVKFSATAFT